MKKKKKQPSKTPKSHGDVESGKILEENRDSLNVSEGNRATLNVLEENGASSCVGQKWNCQINPDIVSMPSVSSPSNPASVEGFISVNESQGSSKEGEGSVNSSPVSHFQVSVQGMDATMEHLRHEYRLEQQAALNSVIKKNKLEAERSYSSPIMGRVLFDNKKMGQLDSDIGLGFDVPKELKTGKDENLTSLNVQESLDTKNDQRSACSHPFLAAKNVSPGTTKTFNPIGLNDTGLGCSNSDPVIASGPVSVTDSVLPLATESGPNIEIKNPSVGPILLPENLDSGPLESEPQMEPAPISHTSPTRLVETIIDGLKNCGPDPVSKVNPKQNVFLAQSLQFGSFNSINSKAKPDFNFVCENNLKFGEKSLDIDPVRGTKYWNQDLFLQLTKGLEVEESETRLHYEPPKLDSDGEVIVELNGHFMTKSVKAHRLQLYGYFVGDNLPFQVVKENLIKMWHKFGVTSIIKKSGGFYFFKFATDEGLLQVLERNPWLVKNVPLVLQLWEPDTVLSKPDPTMVPIWVTIKDLPLCLWNGGNIGQIVSCIGKPLMLDKATFDRCETKKGLLTFARVLVEASVSRGLPDRVKVGFPSRDCMPGKVGYLEFGYRWKPPLCHLCGVFGHMTSTHEPKPLTEKSNVPKMDPTTIVHPSTVAQTDGDGFTVVTKKKHKQKNKRKVMWAPIMQAGKNSGPNLNAAGPSRSQVEVVSDGAGPNVKGTGCASAQPNLKGTEVFVPAIGLINSPKQKTKQDDLEALGFVYSNPLIGPVNATIGPGKDLKLKSKVDDTNRFAALVEEDEDDCYDADLGIWDHELALAHKFFNSNTRPPDIEFEKWSKELKAYFRNLKKNSPKKGSPKKNVESDGKEDDKKYEDNEVESEIDGSARFMSLG